SLLNRTGLRTKSFPNLTNNLNVEPLKNLLPEVIDRARSWLSDRRKEFEEKINEKLNEQYLRLERLKDRRYNQLELQFKDSRRPEKLVRALKEKEKRKIERIFDEYLEWVQETMTTEDNPYIQVVAVLKG
ncbi:MAG: ATP-dependent helicase, partial [Deltaproteobacteria bacterium]